MFLLLDAGVLGRLCHTSERQYLPIARRLWQFLDAAPEVRKVFIPEVADYEVRRKLLHLIAKGQSLPEMINRLNSASEDFTYLPLDTVTMQLAAELWADARLKGLPTAIEASLDADVILAAQAKQVGGTVVTTNRKHLSRFVPTIEWTEFPASA